jgi:hypothetical protein
VRTTLVLLLMSLSLGAAEAPKEGSAYIAPKVAIHVVTDEEAEVYAAFVSQAFGANKQDGPLARQTVLLENDALDRWQPGRRAWEKYLLKRVRGTGRASEEAHAAFLGRPQQVIRFYSFPAINIPVRLLRSDVLKQALDEGGWDAFYDRYPNTQGVLSFSGIAFSPDKTEATLAARLQCGKRCGYRDLVLMRRVNGAWLLIMKDALP